MPTATTAKMVPGTCGDGIFQPEQGEWCDPSVPEGCPPNLSAENCFREFCGLGFDNTQCEPEPIFQQTFSCNCNSINGISVFVDCNQNTSAIYEQADCMGMPTISDLSFDVCQDFIFESLKAVKIVEGACPGTVA